MGQPATLPCTPTNVSPESQHQACSSARLRDAILFLPAISRQLNNLFSLSERLVGSENQYSEYTQFMHSTDVLRVASCFTFEMHTFLIPEETRELIFIRLGNNNYIMIAPTARFVRSASAHAAANGYAATKNSQCCLRRLRSQTAFLLGSVPRSYA